MPDFNMADWEWEVVITIPGSDVSLSFLVLPYQAYAERVANANNNEEQSDGRHYWARRRSNT